MTPVTVIKLPHNGRCALYPGEVDEEGEPLPYPSGPPDLVLPIPMPGAVMVITGKSLDDVLAIDVLGEDGGRIRREDVETVWLGIQQYNRDCDPEDGDQE